jgi:hypothetical protein
MSLTAPFCSFGAFRSLGSLDDGDCRAHPPLADSLAMTGGALYVKRCAYDETTAFTLGRRAITNVVRRGP